MSTMQNLDQRHPPRSRLRRTWLPAALCAALVLAGCSAPPSGRDAVGAVDGSTSKPSASPASSASAAPLPSDAPSAPIDEPTPSPVASVVPPAAGVLPRSLAYGVLLWTVRDAAITNQDPKRYVAGQPGAPTAKTSLILDLDIRNDNVVVGIVSSGARLVLTSPDGLDVPGTNVLRSSVPPVSSVDGRFVFEVPEGTGFDGLVVTFADPGREPSIGLPLSGPAPAMQRNTTVDLGKAMRPRLPKVDMTWTIGSLIIGYDWPLPVGFKGGSQVAGTRAEAGHRWLGIVARVRVGACGCKGGVLDQAGSARLFVDGVPITASAGLSSNSIMNTDTISDVMLVFAVPATATTATLRVGPLDTPSEQASMELDLD